MSTNLEIFNAYNNALIAGDFAALFETMADDIIWHQPGNHSTSGAKIGKEVLGAHLATFAEKTNGTFKVVTNWVSDNDTLVAANVTFLGTRTDGEELNMNGVDLFRMEEGKIKEVWLFSADQKAEDAFWG
ncbi:nuclear transport factor 2 family protein [Streptococcus suis]|uniref:nuclear transport factor 2 family protein n=1 Tax=Streptococcus suis TaxID=1307 RepID=UPI00040FC4B1|nr:nuclear transport factor 2 family protein [Streptococcus suis]NQN10197.1 nuclear transport factor 2 family protein [Streptococcus suis]NQN96395.1 nuclear transport factor 2 family protein [Streptococcus suis]HEM5043151.1 nuclear transport factor 2 family protein [Streptococcus suis]HEM5093132.1 nuclear transport factor 2 family protein [Streptococcus suis]HEM5116168.1 nuclear transport factor 2 family protein [Streptococcus suis]